MLDQCQTIYENGEPRIAVIDFKEYTTAKNILNNEESLEDFLDFLHIQKIKAKNEERVDIETAKLILGLT